jgi:transcriptional regulator with XRE-family HTH domain
VVILLPHGSNKTTLFKTIGGKQKRRGQMFGEFTKKRRIDKGLGLREFCKQIEMDASNWSKIERGVLSPPQDEEKLRNIAHALGIKFGSKKWKDMKDMANIDAGIIPADFLSDKKVLNSLPMFFRTIRSEKPTPEELDKLINIIRS